MDLKMAVKFGSQGFAVWGTYKALRQARTDRDTLRTLDAIVSGLAVATSIALLVRELREQNLGLED